MKERLHLEVAGITIELPLAPAGSFAMGSTNEDFSEAPVHRVTILRSFYLGKLPVTQRQWAAICGHNQPARPPAFGSRVGIRVPRWFHRRPNAWGFHDMTGNVWEWCADHWHTNYRAAPDDGRAWLEPHVTRPLRCLRGGAWDMNAFRCRSCYRSRNWENLAANRFGFRICVE